MHMRERHTGEAVTQVLDGSGLLLLANLLVLLLVGSSLEALPRESTAQKVHENVTKGFKIVPARLLTTQMRVDTHVTSCSGQALAFPIGDVLLRLRVAVLLGHTEINDMNDIGSLRARAADKEVVRLNIPVDEILLVNGLHS